MSKIMFVTKRYTFVLLKFIIFVLQVCSVWNVTPRKENTPYSLRNIDYFRRKFGPVKMLSHADNHSDLNEVTHKADDEIHQNDESVTVTLQDDDDTAIIQKDLMPAISVIEDPIIRKEKGLPPIRPKQVVKDHSIKNCWMDANAKEHFKLMNGLDDRYASVRMKYQEAAEKNSFSKNMLEMMIKTRGVAQREIHKAKGDSSFIPAGINLGGYGMLRLDDSILFFHRMKLRNDTHFRVNWLVNDLANMALTAQLSLNDLHILGAYERATTLSDPVQLFYTPTFGEAEFLLKNVQYNMDGRYRMMRDKLAIELVISNIIVSDILLTYKNSEKCGKSVVLERKNIDELLERLKVDLDKWLKDYFNDYLIYFELLGEKSYAKFVEYNQKKTIALNEYTDKMVGKIGLRLRELKLCAVRLPQFSVTAVNGMQLKLTHGVLRGLESLHRRSLATGKRENGLRKVNAIVGFSSLKATYQYEAVFNTGVPPINGMLVVTADEMIAHFSLTLTEDPKSGDLRFDSIQQLKPESLILEGPANRVIGNFKALLERHVFTFISNAIIHNVNMLRTVTQCEPLLFSIHFTCEEEKENETKLDTSTEYNKIGKLSHLTPNDKETSLENVPLEINSNTGNDNENIEQDIAESEQRDDNLNNGGEENNEESTVSKGGADIEIKLIANNENNANDYSEANTNLDTNNDDIKKLALNKLQGNAGGEGDELNTSSANNNNIEVKIIPKVEDNIDDSSETNRNLGTYDKETDKNAYDNTEINRNLDANTDENNNDNEKAALSNTGEESDEENTSLTNTRNVEIKIIPNDEDNSDDNSETNRKLETNDDKENTDK